MDGLHDGKHSVGRMLAGANETHARLHARNIPYKGGEVMNDFDRGYWLGVAVITLVRFVFDLVALYVKYSERSKDV